MDTERFQETSTTIADARVKTEYVTGVRDVKGFALQKFDEIQEAEIKENILSESISAEDLDIVLDLSSPHSCLFEQGIQAVRGIAGRSCHRIHNIDKQQKATEELSAEERHFERHAISALR